MPAPDNTVPYVGQRQPVILGKYQVTAVKHGNAGCMARIRFVEGLLIWLDIPAPTTLQVGDWLTLVTMVPIKGEVIQ